MNICVLHFSGRSKELESAHEGESASKDGKDRH